MNAHTKDAPSARTWAALLFVLLSGGCDDIRLGNLLPAHATLTRSEVEPPGAQCERGGSVVFAGPDENDDGVLSESEVTTARYVCADPLPAMLTRLREEPKGARCEHGGRAVDSGLDLNANGVFDDGERLATEYVCATAYPGVLVRTEQIPPGTTCPHGGQLAHAGFDADGDGLLSVPEATRDTLSCMEPAPEPVLSRQVLLGVRPDPCGTQNAYAVEAGFDLDLDGGLDDDEVRATTRMCNPMVPLLRRHREEPPGSHCITGGVAVMAGGDLSGDNELQDEEVRHTAYVCQPASTFHGDYELRDISDAAALQSVARIQGSLIISAPELRELVLPGLESVEGSLTVQDNSLLTRLELPSLSFVRADLTVTDHPLLTQVVLGTSESIGYPLYVGGSLRIERNNALTDMSGLGRSVPRRDFVLRKNNRLTAPGEFSFVESLQGDLVIEFNELLPAPPLFPNLRDIGGTLNLHGNPALATLVGLRTLQRINEDLIVDDNDSLTTVSELTKLLSTHLVSVKGNKGLRTFSLPSLFSARTGIHVEDNETLEEVGPFGGRLELGDFMLSDNPALLRIQGLGSPLNISGTLTLLMNKKVESLGAFAALTSLRTLDVQYANALTSLEGLHHITSLKTLTVRRNQRLTQFRLDALTNVSEGFEVTFNPFLPACLVVALAEAVHTGPLDQRYVRSNHEGAICDPPPEVSGQARTDARSPSLP
ncbi:hypothetical protein MYSTI_07287 [Myxococcus stipitatus DSM 14675]|uniref:DUF7151 domain-containing protein n=1 Tax=Myxococcus stipitatus (strain DSM 14675 / JCM 12634 / Mx s8) TaxID=1278073 RepID=L7UPS9_MYXSD|nr:leucine-rich repeat domain-containing protein [Myxococcus stipitatus]AGC48559.1 hypothetical protein MYSTI_07287 [Myxococcus stipitatus DSM 14675]